MENKKLSIFHNIRFYKLIGIVGSFASIIGLILYFYPLFEKQAAQLTVYITDVKGNVVLEHEGELNISIGNRPLREKIGENGRTNFDDILTKHLGDSITIGFRADGWKLVDENNNFVFNGEPIYLKIERDNSLSIIKGTVRTRDGNDYISDAIIYINADTIIRTNNYGVFNITLPVDMQVKNIAESYKLTISKEKFNTKTIDYYPKSSDVEIRLDYK